MRVLVAAAALALIISACAKTDGPAVGTASDDPAVAAATAKAIEASPAAADSILKAAGHTQESFEKLMYDIAADSAKSAAYAAAKTP